MDTYNLTTISVPFTPYFRVTVTKLETSTVIKIGIVFWTAFLLVVETCVLVDENRNDFIDMVTIKQKLLCCKQNNGRFLLKC